MSIFPVQNNSCVVVIVPLAVSDDEAKKANDCLDSDEVARRDRYVTPELRRRFSVCRGRLRMLLGKILNTLPSEIAFQYGNRGKPNLGLDTSIQFNVSHSQDWAMIALASGAQVGVDLELIDRNFNEEAIASQLLNTDDFATWICLPEASRREALISLWVAKEAILKSVGVGIAESLKKLVLPIPLPKNECLVKLDDILDDRVKDRSERYQAEWKQGQEWRLQMITELPIAMAAVCFEQQIELQKICRWDDVFAR